MFVAFYVLFFVVPEVACQTQIDKGHNDISVQSEQHNVHSDNRMAEVRSKVRHVIREQLGFFMEKDAFQRQIRAEKQTLMQLTKNSEKRTTKESEIASHRTKTESIISELEQKIAEVKEACNTIRALDQQSRIMKNFAEFISESSAIKLSSFAIEIHEKQKMLETQFNVLKTNDGVYPESYLLDMVNSGEFQRHFLLDNIDQQNRLLDYNSSMLVLKDRLDTSSSGFGEIKVWIEQLSGKCGRALLHSLSNVHRLISLKLTRSGLRDIERALDTVSLDAIDNVVLPAQKTTT